MTWEFFSLDETVATPWRNGGGVTRELLAWPEAANWRVRMSVAQVEADGPFSRFDGVRRWFAVLDGAGVRLQVGGAEHVLMRDSAPFPFDGGVATDCTLLAGPTRDFNLMLRGGRGKMARVRGSLAPVAQPGLLVAVYSQQPAHVECGQERVDLPPGTLAWRILDAACELRIASADALWMEVEP
jgi:uncharacterized protein